MFCVFFAMLLIHGPVFWLWAMLPISMYVFERLMRLVRGNRPVSVNRVEWIPPVLAVQVRWRSLQLPVRPRSEASTQTRQFRPHEKEDFPMREGQYLYLNCPYISQDEWHPFTISSARGDLTSGPRVSLDTGEEVVQVPKPHELPPGAKWAKYCAVSQVCSLGSLEWPLVLTN